MSTDRAEHWDEVFTRTGGQGVSWYEDEPRTSLAMIAGLTVRLADAAIVDIGGGASALVDGLILRGARDVTVLDVSADGLERTRTRLGAAADVVDWVVSDVVAWQPEQRYDVWHDRAVFHFLTSPDEVAAYRGVLRAALRPGGHAVIATFAEDGPTTCSGLPTARYSADELVASIGPGFDEVLRDRRVHVTPSGSEQPFTWVVLRRDGEPA